MSSTFAQNTPFLRVSRSFPTESEDLSQEVDRTYVDLANAINDRTIGIFSVNRSSVTGESWFITSRKQQTQRQLYPITGPGSYPHGLDFSKMVGFTRIYGTGFATPNWYPLPYVDASAATDQIQIVVDSDEIVITAGGGAPVITSGFVVLEWLSRA